MEMAEEGRKEIRDTTAELTVQTLLLLQKADAEMRG